MTLRTEEVRPPSLRAESLAVAVAACCVVFGSAVVIALERGGAETRRGASSAPGGASWPGGGAEVAFADLAGADQRVFRAVQEGVLEAENVRGATGEWPTVQVLAAQGIPPFAPDPIDRAGYTWSHARSGTAVNYLGTPAAGSGRPCFLAIILEPDPGTPMDPTAPTDEIHHRLSDGTMLHVSIWMGPPLSDLGKARAVAPVGKGWARIAVAGAGF